MAAQVATNRGARKASRKDDDRHVKAEGGRTALGPRHREGHDPAEKDGRQHAFAARCQQEAGQHRQQHHEGQHRPVEDEGGRHGRASARRSAIPVFSSTTIMTAARRSRRRAARKRARSIRPGRASASTKANATDSQNSPSAQERHDRELAPADRHQCTRRGTPGSSGRGACVRRSRRAPPRCPQAAFGQCRQHRAESGQSQEDRARAVRHRHADRHQPRERRWRDARAPTRSRRPPELEPAGGLAALPERLLMGRLMGRLLRQGFPAIKNQPLAALDFPLYRSTHGARHRTAAPHEETKNDSYPQKSLARRHRCRGRSRLCHVGRRSDGTQDPRAGGPRRRLGPDGPLHAAGPDAIRHRQERAGHQRSRRRRLASASRSSSTAPRATAISSWSWAM